MAVWPSPEIVRTIASIDRPEVPGLRWTRPEQWHVTLRFLGPLDDPERVIEAISTVRAPAPVAELGPAVGRFGSQVLHVPVAGLEELAADAVATTAELGEPPDSRPFRGHITLARVSRTAKVKLSPLAGAPVSGRWRAREVTVVASELDRDGARYSIVARHGLA